jgi:hypothetical protein
LRLGFADVASGKPLSAEVYPAIELQDKNCLRAKSSEEEAKNPILHGCWPATLIGIDGEAVRRDYQTRNAAP